MEVVLLAAALVMGYLVGAIPGSNIMARLAHGPDLRRVGSGMVTPSNLYYAMGLKPALVAGVFEVAKGTVGPLLVGSGRVWMAAIGAALAVSGHNWSVFLKGAGGRGLSTATGALAVVAWPGAALMCAALMIGISTRRVFPAMSLALVALVPFIAIACGSTEAVACAIVAVPVAIKTAILLYRERAAKHRAVQP